MKRADLKVGQEVWVHRPNFPARDNFGVVVDLDKTIDFRNQVRRQGVTVYDVKGSVVIAYGVRSRWNSEPKDRVLVAAYWDTPRSPAQEMKVMEVQTRDLLGTYQDVRAEKEKSEGVTMRTREQIQGIKSQVWDIVDHALAPGVATNRMSMSIKDAQFGQGNVVITIPLNAFRLKDPVESST